MKMNITNTPNPKMLVIRPFRQTCEAFYEKFKRFEVDYLDLGKVHNLAPFFIKNLKDRIKTADVVNISDNYYFYNAQVIFWAKVYKKPVVTILWATIPNHISSWLPPYSSISKYVVKNTDLFILRNKSALGFVLSIGAPGNKIKVFYKGIDIKHFYPKKFKNTNNTTILYVGKLVKSKGVEDLLDVFEDLYKKHKNIKLVLAGVGPLSRKIPNNLPVKLLGNVDYKNLGKVYRQADIFCSPSKPIKIFGIKIWEEYFSYTLMEAQASGLPIVTTKIGGIPEEVDHQNEIVNPGDRRALYKSLEKLILNKNLRSKLSVVNRERALKLFNAKVQAEKTEREILEIC